MRQWFVIQTNPREEERALHYVNEKGVETFFPKIQVVRYRNVKSKMTLKPMFPSYFFARFRLSDELPYVRWTRGVKRILGSDDKPTAVEDDVVDFIKSRVNEKGVAKVGRKLRPKDKVRVRSGPFKDLIGIFERVIDDEGRTEILLKMVRYQARIQLHESLLERVS